MKFETFKILQNLDEKIDEGIPITIFKGYRAINKRGVEKLIDELYANLPNDVKKAREYLKNKNIELNTKPSKLYDNISNLESSLNQGFHIAKYVIINIQELEQLLDKIYASIPNEIVAAKNIEKNIDNM